MRMRAEKFKEIVAFQRQRGHRIYGADARRARFICEHRKFTEEVARTCFMHDELCTVCITDDNLCMTFGDHIKQVSHLSLTDDDLARPEFHLLHNGADICYFLFIHFAKEWHFPQFDFSHKFSLRRVNGSWY